MITSWSSYLPARKIAGAVDAKPIPSIAATKNVDSDIVRLSQEPALRNTVNIATVKDMRLHNVMRFSSTVESRNPGTASVTCLLHGVVSRVLADVGDKVQAGQIVAYINCPDVSDAQSVYVERRAHGLEAAANYEFTRTRLKIAEAEIARLKSLSVDGITARKDVESAESRTAGIEAELQTAKAMVSSSEIQLESSKSRLLSFGLEPTTVDKVTTELPLRSPISGLVSERTAQAGLPVGPLSGATNAALFKIIDLSRVWVMLEVPQDEISHVHIGAKVSFTTEVAPGKSFKGRVTKLGETFDAASRTASIRTEIENPNFILKPGMLVLADVSTDGSLQQQLTIPEKAIQKLSNKTVVFKEIGPLTFKVCPVSIGRCNRGDAEIQTGLSLGDRVATNGSFLLKSEVMKNAIGEEQ